MTNVQYLLTCLMEECAEVAHRCSKAIRFGLDEIESNQGLSNEKRITNEVCDLRGVISELQNYGIFKDLLIPGYVNTRRVDKQAKLRQYMKYSREQGIFDDD